MDENKLANVRRDIVNRKRLSEAELEELRQNVKEKQPNDNAEEENLIIEQNENLQYKLLFIRTHGKRARCSADSREKYQLDAYEAVGPDE